MPYKSWKCKICGCGVPKKFLGHGYFEDRMSFIRHHRKLCHPKAHKESVKKSIRTKKERGIL